MQTALPDMDRRYTREEYRAWCEAQPSGRYERVDGHIVAMAPERVAHARMKFAVALALRQAIAKARVRCQALPDGVTVETADSDFEPDALVHCGEPIPGDAIAVPNPVIVVEVLSRGTGSVDTGRKLAGYFTAPSIQHYLIVDPIRRMVIHHRRDGEGIATRLLAGGPIALDPPGLMLTVEEFYETE